MDNVYCKNCGTLIAPGQRFCGKCGQVADAVSPGYYPPPQAAPQYPNTRPAGYPQAARKKGTVMVILSFVFLVLAIGVFVAALLFLGGADVRPSQLNGQWQSTLKIDKIIKDTAFTSGTKEGEEQDMALRIELKSNGSGTMTMGSAQFVAAYKSGKLVAECDAQGLLIHMEGRIVKSGSAYAIEGSWVCSASSGKDKGELAYGSWTAESGKETAE